MTNQPRERQECMPCPRGGLSAFAEQEKVRRRRRFLLRAGGIAGAAMGMLVLSAGAGWWAFREEETLGEPVYAGIACSRVRELAPMLMMSRLDAPVVQQIQAHLEQCEACRTLLQSMPAPSGAA